MTFDEAVLRVKKICSNQEKCSQDIHSKLNNWGLPAEKADKIIKILVEENFINEERYAKAFVNDKFKFNKWGEIKIKTHLISKKISESAIKSALGNIDIDEYINLLKDILKKKKEGLKYKNNYELTGKLIQYAFSKGFDIDTTKETIKQLTDEDVSFKS